MCERCRKLEDAILAIDARATPYGSPIVENGEEYVRAYIMPAGPLHRALGVVGRSAVKVSSHRVELPAEMVGMTLRQEPEPVEAPRFSEPIAVK